MAGSSISSEEDKALAQTRCRQSHSHYSSLYLQHTPTNSKHFIQRRTSELKFFTRRHVNILQQDINRIFNQSLHYDLEILHNFEAIRTNQCIIQSRSPLLYNILRPHISHNNDYSYCHVEQLELYRQIKNLVRLLYTNSDVSHHEQVLFQLILNEFHSCFGFAQKISERDDVFEATHLMNRLFFKNVRGKSGDRNSPTSSDMADSGLGSGSITSPQETLSENSSTDLDEPTETRNPRRRTEKPNTEEGFPIFEKCSNFSRSSSREFEQNRNKLNDPEVCDVSRRSRHTRVDSDHFPEVNVSAASFVHTRPGFIVLNNGVDKKNQGLRKDEQIVQNGRPISAALKDQRANLGNAANSNNCCFIDASSLADDVDMTTPDAAKYDENARSCWSISQVLNDDHSSHVSNGCESVDHSSIDTNQQPSDTASRCRAAASELHSNPLSTSANSKTLDKLNYSQVTHNNSSRSTNKESLFVEIKEADSGESALHSPCPDNTHTDSEQDNQQEKLESSNLEEERQDNASGSEDTNRRPPLIRRNTFELDPNDEKLSSLRQEYERRQGSLVFQNSITQYSQHRVDGEPPFLDSTRAHESSDAPSGSSNFDADSDPGNMFAPTTRIPRRMPDKYDLDIAEKELKSSRPLSSVFDDDGEVENVELRCSMPRSSSDRLLSHYDGDDLSFSSLPVTINDVLAAGDRRGSACSSKLRRNEMTPIVSGGACSTDFNKPPESPIVKRKTESTPIVSGGSVVMPQVEAEPRRSSFARRSLASSMTAAWVVDMSDCRSSASDKSTTSFSAAATTTTKSVTRDRSQPSSLGYFVSLDDVQPPKSSAPATKESAGTGPTNHRRRPSDAASERSYCEFFVDLSDKSTPADSSTDVKSEASTESSSCPSDARKNMFSMFIDLGDTNQQQQQPRPGFSKSSSSSRLADKRFEFSTQQQRRSSGSNDLKPATPRQPTGGVFMYIESDNSGESPMVRRRTLSSSRPAFKRHSWNQDRSSSEHTPTAPRRPLPSMTHKRAHSLSVERPVVVVSANSSSEKSCRPQSLATPSQTEQQMERHTEDAPAEYDAARDTPPNSHVEVVDEELLVSLQKRNYRELERAVSIGESGKLSSQQQQLDECCSEGTETIGTRKSETFDVVSSSSASCPSSSTSENFDSKLTTDLESVPNSTAVVSQDHDTKPVAEHEDDQKRSSNKLEEKRGRSAQPTSFVRLSDLDKRPLSNSANSSVKSTGTNAKTRLSVSMTGTSWVENKLVKSFRDYESVGDTTMPPRRLPLSVATALAKSDNFDDFEKDRETVVSESDLSSLQSSMGRSGQGSTEETETSSIAMSKPYNRLGEDLLRMFIEEINPDVTIDVGGRRIRAHKCILSSRCQYFAAILSGGWIESAGNIISLQGYSYNAVHFALCHIYSGESCIPDTISIVELATLADMLCLEGLKEVIAFTLRVKYCHLFHKPCNGCSVGVLECMPLAAAYGLDEVYRKSLRWVTRHFVRIWPTKEFATLPRELMDKCYHQHIVHMSTDNVLQTIMDCDKLLTTLPNVRWAEPVFRLVSNLVDASMKYLTDNFAGVLGNDSFQCLDRELTWNISRLEDHLLAAAERLPPEQACRAYSKLDKMFTLADVDDGQFVKYKWSILFAELMKKIQSRVEKSLIRDAARAARTNAWHKMDLELRRRIQELACLVLLPSDFPTKVGRPSRHSNFFKESKDRLESKVPVSKTPANRSLDLRRVKMAISEHNDRTSKQTPLLQKRKVMNKPKTDPLERKMQTEKLMMNETSVSRPKSWPKIEVKSRYLEPRTRITPKESPLPKSQDKTLDRQQKKKVLISSSDSSRTSSPAMKRAAERKSLLRTTKVPIKKDGKALSSDSLAESNNRLSIRKEIASKSLGITRPESPSLRVKDMDGGLSVDSLADPKKKSGIRKVNRTDAAMSADSLMTDVTTVTTPKSIATNKSSPVLGKIAGNPNINQIRNQDRIKKTSPPVQQRNTPTLNRRPARSLESSTAASRSRAAAVLNTYQGSLNLRKSLLDAAKAPDIPSKTLLSVTMTKSNTRQSITQSVRLSYSAKQDRDRKDESCANQRSNSSPGSKRSPKTNLNSRLSKSTVVQSNRQKVDKFDKRPSNKTESRIAENAEGPKFLKNSSRSGTFSKDEPTILKKSDIDTAAIDV
ncbi:hypothetical protein QAD02_024306 [Eretmocerus hayati]|uniref:Uncharacterized protein n=1 Tax=Eretmocerus hayati TaxID=131215 RepID=A0ACC2Q0H8_9HYME|nr:hypothetical protein QAD02_024306 [Eretmocerus hayati]